MNHVRTCDTQLLSRVGTEEQIFRLLESILIEQKGGKATKTVILNTNVHALPD